MKTLSNILVGAALVLLPCATANAGRPLTVSSTRSSRATDGSAFSLTTVRQRARARGFAIADEVVLHAATEPSISRPGATIVEVRGTVGGVPLDRPVGKLLVDPDGRVRYESWSGSVGALSGSAEPTLGREDARAIAALRKGVGRGSAGSPTLQVLPGEFESRLVYRVTWTVRGRSLDNRIVYVDANTGNIVQIVNPVLDALAHAYPANPALTPELVVSELADPPSGTTLVGQNLAVRSCEATASGCNYVERAAADADGNFLPPVPDDHAASDDAFAEVSVYVHADRFFSHLRSLGFDHPLCEATGTEVGPPRFTATVNYFEAEQPYDNAYYATFCEDTMVLGQGAALDYAYDGDVIVHEMGHGIVSAQGGGLYAVRPLTHALSGDAQALNEGFADYFSSAYFDDPIVGDYGLGGQARNNDNDLTCNDALAGEPHIDSEAWAGALWEIHRELGAPFYRVVIDALALLYPDSTFEDASMAVVAATEVALGVEAANTVGQVFDARQLSACERVVPVGELTRTVWMNYYTGYAQPLIPPPFQLRFDVPEDAVSMTVTAEFAAFDYEAGPLQLHLKRANLIEFSYAIHPADYYPFEVIEDAERVLELDITRNRVSIRVDIEDGAPIYGYFSYFDDQIATIDDIRVEFEVDESADASSSSGSTEGDDPDDDSAAGEDTTGEPPAEPSSSETGGAEQTSDGDDGCGCRQSASPAWAVLVLVGLGIRRRRPSER